MNRHEVGKKQKKSHSKLSTKNYTHELSQKSAAKKKVKKILNLRCIEKKKDS